MTTNGNGQAAGPETDPFSTRLLYSPQNPTPPQHAFLLLDELGVLEAFYGGAGGGGKSSALLMAALKYVDVPGYAALLLRKTFADLALPGALMDRGKQWLVGVDGVRWDNSLYQFTVPKGATLNFGYLQTSVDKYRYQGAEFQFIGFDELTHFDEADYRYLFTRLRRPELPDDAAPAERARLAELSRVPLRMRTASNPGGRGHEWVKRRYILRKPDPDDPEDTPEKARRRVFVPAKLDDNPHVDRDAYRLSLAEVDVETRQQILDGDWDARGPGDYVYPADGLNAAERLGDELDELLRRRTIPPAAGGLLETGTDWGEHTHGVIGWPLERRGMYVAAGLELVGKEPGESTAALVALLGTIVALGQAANPAALEPGRRPLDLVRHHAYDAAGVQSMRTYLALIRKTTPRARSVAVPFGQPIRSGGPSGTRSYKSETIGFTRRMLRRSAARVYFDDDLEAYVRHHGAPDWDDARVELEVKSLAVVGPLAISPRRAAELLRQLRALVFADVDLGTVAKGDDHGPDALIALLAPHARRNRA
jgi:hypothetical protein